MYTADGAKADCRGVRKGSWTDEEDNLLRKCIDQHGEGNWHRIPLRAGLNRCRKSCRLRWTNYLKPNIKRGQFGEEEIDLIVRLHKLLGNRWSLIAGRIPGRTANDVKNYWNTHLRKKLTTSSSSSTRPPKHPNTLSTNGNMSIRNNKPPITFSTSISLRPQIIRPQPLPKPSSTATKLPEDGSMGRPNKISNHPTENPTLPNKVLGEDEKDGDDDDDDDDDENARWWKNLVEMYEKEGNSDGLGYDGPKKLDMWPTATEMPHWAITQVEEPLFWEDEDDHLWNFDGNNLPQS